MNKKAIYMSPILEDEIKRVLGITYDVPKTFSAFIREACWKHLEELNEKDGYLDKHHLRCRSWDYLKQYKNYDLDKK